MSRQKDYDDLVTDASTIAGKRGESRRRPLPRSASMTDDEPGGRDVVSEIMDAGPGGLLGELTGETSNWDPSSGIRAEVDTPRSWQRAGRSPGTDQDVADHTSCARCFTNPGEGESMVELNDERLAPGGEGEQSWAKASARQRADDIWPRG